MGRITMVPHQLNPTKRTVIKTASVSVEIS
jgi:hypothetical protein